MNRHDIVDSTVFTLFCFKFLLLQPTIVNDSKKTGALTFSSFCWLLKQTSFKFLMSIKSMQNVVASLEQSFEKSSSTSLQTLVAIGSFQSGSDIEC